ncbi:hypothetical protein [Pseudoxanthomonas winnipegensis]|uniref:hypothetical protein n=1 Tax=Pseudoxanthomonas winnipegensis TaxID=2480810 RepID=UPI00103D8F7C|nr:hypothetical protein [Pseudoxanthomonas winnipegensis]TBV70621.1 hypothetical protein EYC45_18185 [Pseudoxanthomonas winnipegensis]
MDCQEPATKAVMEYIQRQKNFKLPKGKWVGSRWYPSPEEDCGITDTIRAPSQNWPNSYFNAARTLKHCAALYGVSHDEAKRTLKELRAQHTDMEIMWMGRKP